MNGFNIDFTYFWYSLVICLGIGVFSAIYKNTVQRIMEETEEKASGRHVAH